MAKKFDVKVNVENNETGTPEIFRTKESRFRILLSITHHTEPATLFSKGSVLELYIPGLTKEEIKNIRVGLSGWVSDDKDDPLRLTCTGPEQTIGKDPLELTIQIDHILTNAQVNTVNLQITSTGFHADFSRQIFTPLVISNPPRDGNADLKEMLQFSLDNSGVIYVSETASGGKQDLLQNKLFLNIKNIHEHALTHASARIGNPRIEAMFVYGNNVGCLTPDDNPQAEGSPWNIEASVVCQSENYPWITRQPDPTSADPHPRWILEPASSNTELFGVGQDANTTFLFSDIVSLTNPGHTQLLLHFTGFMKDEKTPYNDALIILDIIKQPAPSSRGILRLYSVNPVVELYHPDHSFSIELRWQTWYTNKIEIKVEAPAIDSVSDPILLDSTVENGSWEKEIKGIAPEASFLSVTVQAYTSTGDLLNNMQCLIFLRKYFFTDLWEGKSYPAIKIGKKLWTVQNLCTKRPGVKYCKEEGNGLLYPWELLQPPYLPQNGWRLPSLEDWNELIDFHAGSESEKYNYLIKGGGSGFNAVLAGYTTHDIPSNNFEGEEGRYWVSEPDTFNKIKVIVFNKNKQHIICREDVECEPDMFMSVRLVKDIQ